MNVEEVKPSDLEDFKKQVQTEQVAAEKKKMSIRKNLILSYVADSTGCGHIRNVFPFTYTNSLFGKSGSMYAVISPSFVKQQDLLMQTRTLFFQRQMAPGQVAAIKEYKTNQPLFKYKMCYDLDDYIWGLNELQGGNKEDGVPSYNFGYSKITDEVKTSCVEIMNLMDVITVSSPFLKQYIENTLGVKVPIFVVKNSLPKYFWGHERRKGIEKRLEKPRVLYSGSPTHYSNDKKLKGDWDSVWCDYVIKAVKENKIDFTCMGGLPFFFEPIKDKITILNWVNSFDYHSALKSTKPDFVLMPLTPNNFNRSKSDIKAIEAYAVGALAIGSKFSDGSISPYDNCIVPPLDEHCTVQDIENLISEYCRPDKFSRAIKAQNDYMENEGRWTESKKFVAEFIKNL